MLIGLISVEKEMNEEEEEAGKTAIRFVLHVVNRWQISDHLYEPQ